MRRLLLICLAACGFASTGCCLCDAPYDYCYPTFTGEDCGEPECRTCERIGSIHYGGPLPGLYSDPGMVEPVPADPEAEGAAQPGPESYYDGTSAVRGI